MNVLTMKSRLIITYLFFLFPGFLCISCVSESSRTENENVQALSRNDTIEVATQVMNFVMKDTIPSGWNTFKYNNQSEETHFFILEKYPVGKTIDDTRKVIVPIFQEGMNLINAGKGEEAMAKFGELPEWYGEVIFSGGSGLIAPKHTSMTTIKLDPGYYVMECYVKMDKGIFHSAMGMLKGVVVSTDSTDQKPPTPTLEVEVSSTDGYVFDKPVSSGPNIFQVTFKDQKVHENFIQQDLNLVRISKGADKQALETWMNWAVPGGLQTPVPEGFTFLGGTNEMPAGSIAYFKADLEPGEYAFISEVPNTLSKNLFVPFTVSD